MLFICSRILFSKAASLTAIRGTCVGDELVFVIWFVETEGKWIWSFILRGMEPLVSVFVSIFHAFFKLRRRWIVCLKCFVLFCCFFLFVFYSYRTCWVYWWGSPLIVLFIRIWSYLPLNRLLNINNPIHRRTPHMWHHTWRNVQPHCGVNSSDRKTDSAISFLCFWRKAFWYHIFFTERERSSDGGNPSLASHTYLEEGISCVCGDWSYTTPVPIHLKTIQEMTRAHSTTEA